MQDSEGVPSTALWPLRCHGRRRAAWRGLCLAGPRPVGPEMRGFASARLWSRGVWRCRRLPPARMWGAPLPRPAHRPPEVPVHQAVLPSVALRARPARELQPVAQRLREEFPFRLFTQLQDRSFCEAGFVLVPPTPAVQPVAPPACCGVSRRRVSVAEQLPSQGWVTEASHAQRRGSEATL